jgi:hypothetical protein
MNYEDLTYDICRLVDDNNRWSSVIVIPQGDGFLDISSALQGDLSVAPVGATNQPAVLPVGTACTVDCGLLSSAALWAEAVRRVLEQVVVFDMVQSCWLC